MSESKKKSAANTDDSPQKKKARPPPLSMNDSAPIPFPQPTFSLPTMRGAAMYSQQHYVVLPSSQLWDSQEQAQLERFHRTICFPNESLLSKSIKIAASLQKKTVRDVAARLKLMEEFSSSPSRQEDDVDRILNRGDAILAELTTIPARNRTEEQNEKLQHLLREFTSSTRDVKAKLDQKQLKIPTQFVANPEVPENLRSLLQ